MDTNSDVRRFWTPARRRFVLVGYVLVLIGATHWPSEMRGIQTDHGDKIVHFAAFTVLAWLLAWAMELPRRTTFTTVSVLLFAIALFAALDEVTQPFVGRQCDPLDWVADMAGAFVGITIYAIGARRSAIL